MVEGNLGDQEHVTDDEAVGRAFVAVAALAGQGLLFIQCQHRHRADGAQVTAQVLFGGKL